MRAAGVNVALGSDGPMVDYGVDMIEQMKACSMLQNAKHLDPTAMSPERCLEMATINAAKALGWDSLIGSLEPGKRADIAVVNLRTPHAMPANNPITSLVYSARGTDTHVVFVNGEIVVRDGKIARQIDIDALMSKAQTRALAIIDKAELHDRLKLNW